MSQPPKGLISFLNDSHQLLIIEVGELGCTKIRLIRYLTT